MVKGLIKRLPDGEVGVEQEAPSAEGAMVQTLKTSPSSYAPNPSPATQNTPYKGKQNEA